MTLIYIYISVSNTRSSFLLVNFLASMEVKLSKKNDPQQLMQILSDMNSFL